MLSTAAAEAVDDAPRGVPKVASATRPGRPIGLPEPVRGQVSPHRVAHHLIVPTTSANGAQPGRGEREAERRHAEAAGVSDRTEPFRPTA